jgi:hypothetical protein
LAKLYEGANSDKPDPQVEAPAAAIAKMKFTEPPAQIKKEIAALKADKSIPDVWTRKRT